MKESRGLLSLPDAQVLIAADRGTYDRLATLAPDLVHIMHDADNDYSALAGRDVIVLGEVPESVAQASPARLRLIAEPLNIAVESPEQFLTWAKTNIQLYESAAQGTGYPSPGLPDSSPAVVSPDAADPIESTEQAAVTVRDSMPLPSGTVEPATVDPIKAAVQNNNLAEIAAMREKYLLQKQLQEIAADTIVGRKIIASQTDDEPDVGLSEPADIPEPPEYALDGPDSVLGGHNGHERIDPESDEYTPSGVRVRTLAGHGFIGVTPVDLLAVAQQVEIDLSILPGWLADRHGDISRRTGCDAGISLITDLIALGALADCNYRAQPRANDWKFTQQTGFFGTVVGDTGTRKTAASDAALEIPWQIDAAEQKKAAIAIKKSILDRKKYDAAVADWVKDSKKSGAEIPAPIEPEPDTFSYFKVNDFTIEGLRRMLTNCHNGVLITTDEMQTLVGGLGRYSAAKGAASADKGFILQLYDGGPKHFVRGGDSGAIVPNWKASILALTTPQSIRECLPKNTEADGFLQRQLICCPVLARVGEDREPDAVSLLHFEKICNNLMSMRNGQKTVLKFEPAAVEFYREFEAKVRKLVMNGIYSPAMCGALDKWTGTLPRLALLLELCSYAAHGQVATERDKIQLHSVKMAADILLEYQVAQQRYFWEYVVGTLKHVPSADPMIVAICNWIVAHELEAFTLREMARNASSTQWNALLEKPNGQANIMQQLEDAGWIDPDTARPARHRGLYRSYRVHPGVHAMYRGPRRDRIVEIRKARREQVQILRGVIPATAESQEALH